MTDKHFCRQIFTIVILAILLPPFIGGSIMGILGIYPMPDFYLIFYNYSGLYVLIVLLAGLYATKLVCKTLVNLPTLELTQQEIKAQQILRPFPLYLFLITSLYSIGGALSADFSLENLGVVSHYSLQQHLYSLFGLVPVILITVFPIYFYFNDLLGRYLAPRGIHILSSPMGMKLLMLGLVTPTLIDTVLLNYFYKRTGFFSIETLLIWFSLLIVAGIGTYMAWKSYRQSILPLEDFVFVPSPDIFQARAQLRPQSLDELGLLTAQWAKLLERQAQLRTQVLESEQRANAVFQQAAVGMAIVSIDGRFIEVNSTLCNILGYQKEELLELSFQEITHPEDLELDLSLAKQVLNGKIKSYSLEKRYLRKDGGVVPINLTVNMQFDAEGKPEQFIAVIEDITERDRVAKELQNERNFVNTVLDNAGALIIVLDKNGHICRFNKACERITQFSFAEVKDKCVWDLLLKPDEAHIVQQNAFEALLLNPAISTSIYTNHWVARDGVEHLIEWSNSLLFDEHGQVKFIVSIGSDITAKHQAEQALLASAQRLKEAQHLSQIGSWELDLLENKLVWSEEVFRIFEISSGTVPSYEAFLALVHQADREMVNTAYLDSVKNHTKYNIIHRLQMTDDRIKYVHERGETFYLQGQAIRSIGTVQDITQAKLAEEELRLYREQLEIMVKKRTSELEAVNHELEAFAYSVSHDLRSPLRSINGFSQALLEDYTDKLDSTGQEYLNRIRSASQRMGNLIDDLLKLSRITRATLKYQQVDLSSIALQVLHQLQEITPNHHVEFRIESGLKATGDSGLIKIAMENLLGNAWKYSAKQAQPYIEFGSRLEHGESVYFVSDNGVGFDMQYAEKLFVAFQRLHRRDQFEGNGIGLATVKRIIHRHGGRIWAESQPDQKTAFYFTLPNQYPELESGLQTSL